MDRIVLSTALYLSHIIIVSLRPFPTLCEFTSLITLCEMSTDAMERCVSSGSAVMVHCGGGKGRAGTVLACYMCQHGLLPMTTGAGGSSSRSEMPSVDGAVIGVPSLTRGRHEPRMTAEDSVRVLRELRPGSIETPQQQRFVGEYSSWLWKQYRRGEVQAEINSQGNVQPDRFSELTITKAVSTRQELPCMAVASPPRSLGDTSDGQAARGGNNSSSVGCRGVVQAGDNGGGAGGRKGLKLPRLMLLVGLPGSGKSTFAERLVASGNGWVRICQDESGGSRRDCEAAFERATLKGSDHGRHVVLDRWATYVQHLEGNRASYCA